MGGEKQSVDYRIPEDIVEDIRIHADIVEIISEYVSLQRKGKNFLGLCPFHSEKTPSFTVTPDKQMYYCFGCHAGGNAFSFLMKKENWSFPETLEHLAHKYGIMLPEKELSPREKEQQARRHRWEELHELATDYFHDILMNRPEGEPGRQYFSKRGVDLQTMNTFRLGYAPERWEGLLEALAPRGVRPEELAEVGLAIEREAHEGKVSRGYYDRFRNRVIFAILDSRQKPIAFGGRVLDDALPKYLNSPETAFFSKGHHLYGMNRAYQGIREYGFALLCEGYMDVIALQKAGFTHAVASLGTALTRDQAKLLRRYSRRIVVVYDSDKPGIQATLRAGEILKEEGFRVDVLSLVGAKDPDEYLQSQGSEKFKEDLDQAKPYIEFKYQVYIQDHSVHSAPEKRELVSALAGDILKVTSPVEREGYERFLSLELGLTLEAVQLEIASKDRNKPKNLRENEYSTANQDISVKNRDNINRYVNPVPSAIPVPSGVIRAERILLRLLLEQLVSFAQVEAELDKDFWKVPIHQQLFNAIEEVQLQNRTGIPINVSEELQSQIANIMVEEADVSQPEKLFQDCLRQIRSIQSEETVEELQTRMVSLEKSGDMAGAMALLKEIGERLKSGEK
ncbi:DNA primase [Desulfitobacterium metallireducens]|uniref:DNA primase n=1 Tax=Desulfitobacterium metallireducens TaxID=142877 RepID=UPI001FA6EF70|nr:DNA primase [Desulfitobacterium metallireducens]